MPCTMNILFFSITSGQLTRTDSSSVPPTHPVCIYMREEVNCYSSKSNILYICEPQQDIV